MRQITFSAATQDAMREEMKRDRNVFLMGEDIARQGGIFGQFNLFLSGLFVRLFYSVLPNILLRTV